MCVLVCKLDKDTFVGKLILVVVALVLRSTLHSGSVCDCLLRFEW